MKLVPLPPRREHRVRFRRKGPRLMDPLLGGFALARGGRGGLGDLGDPVDRRARCSGYLRRGQLGLAGCGRTDARTSQARGSTRRGRGLLAWLKPHDEQRTHIGFTAHHRYARLSEQYQQRAGVHGHHGGEDQYARRSGA